VEGLFGTIATALGSLVAGVFGAYFLFRGKRVEQETEETKTEAAATTAFLSGQVEFQEFVERVVAQRVTDAVAHLQAQLTEFAEKLSVVQRESHEMNDAIRSRETRLWLWNLEKRKGPMPELPAPILERLGIGHLAVQPTPEDTGPIGTP
jgi:phage shock protein A